MENPNETLDLIQMENIQVFPSYSYIFSRSEQKVVQERIAIPSKGEKIKQPNINVKDGEGLGQ